MKCKECGSDNLSMFMSVKGSIELAWDNKNKSLYESELNYDPYGRVEVYCEDCVTSEKISVKKLIQILEKEN